MGPVTPFLFVFTGQIFVKQLLMFISSLGHATSKPELYLVLFVIIFILNHEIYKVALKGFNVFCGPE